jgi:hypothetical protein
VTGYEVLLSVGIILALILGMLLLPTTAFWVLYAVCAVLAGLLFAAVAVRALTTRRVRR